MGDDDDRKIGLQTHGLGGNVQVKQIGANMFGDMVDCFCDAGKLGSILGHPVER